MGSGLVTGMVGTDSGGGTAGVAGGGVGAAGGVAGAAAVGVLAYGFAAFSSKALRTNSSIASAGRPRRASGSASGDILMSLEGFAASSLCGGQGEVAGMVCLAHGCAGCGERNCGMRVSIRKPSVHGNTVSAKINEIRAE